MTWRETSYALDKYRQEGCKHNLIFAFGNTEETRWQFHGSNNPTFLGVSMAAGSSNIMNVTILGGESDPKNAGSCALGLHEYEY
jgi:hypothetical protein